MLKQWTDAQEDELNARGQAPLIIDRISPAIYHLVSILTSNLPEFRTTGVTDDDVRMSTIFNDLIQHILYTNDFKSHLSDWVKNMCIYGIGFFYCWWDEVYEDGRGEIRVESIHPYDVYVDPESQKKDFSDADRIIVSKMISKDRALVIAPQEYHGRIERLLPTIEDKRKFASSGRHNEWDVKLLDEVIDERKDHIRVIEEYFKERKNYYEIIDTQTGQRTTKDLSEEEFEAFQELPDIKQGLKIGEIFANKIDKIRVTKRVILGNMLLSEEVLPTSSYPVVPIMFEWQRNPYPIGPIRRVKGLQQEINKRRSLMIAHATTSTNNKLLYLQGAFDNTEDIEQEWARPNAAIAINPVGGGGIADSFHVPQPVPLPNALYTLEAEAKSDIEHVLGIFALSLGDPSAAPETFRATLAIEEFGNRRHNLYAREMGFALRRLGRVMIDFIQGFYKGPRIVRIVNPERQALEEIQTLNLNVPVYDVNNPETIARIENDVSIGKFDIMVVDGSTLPSNRWALRDFYMQLYEKGLVDDIEVMKKLDVVDRVGVIQRKSLYSQLQQQIQGLESQNEELQRDLRRMKTKMMTAQENVEKEKARSRFKQKELEFEEDLIRAREQMERAKDKNNGS